MALVHARSWISAFGVPAGRIVRVENTDPLVVAALARGILALVADPGETVPVYQDVITRAELEAALAGGGGGGGAPATTDASKLTTGALNPARIADGSLPFSKMSGQLSDDQIPAAIARDIELGGGSGGLSATQVGQIAGARDLVAIRRPQSGSDIGLTRPTITKMGAPIATRAQVGLPSLYWPCIIRVPDKVYASRPTLGRWRIYLSTDHDSDAGGIAMMHTDAENPDDPGATWSFWRTGGGSAVMFGEGAGSQTETPTVVWNPLTEVFHMMYQIQQNVPGQGFVQTTRMATSTDGIAWTVRGSALVNPSSQIAGYDHTGYAKMWYIDGLWVCWSNLGSGTDVSGGSLWYSYDGLTNWIRDPKKIRASLDWTEGTMRTSIGGLFKYRGELWACGNSTKPASGGAVSDTVQSWFCPVTEDLHSLRGRPQYVDFTSTVDGSTSALGIPSIYATAPDGRLWGAYRINGATGSLGLVVLS